MNETRVFADGYRGVFQKQEDFLECLKSIGKNSFWERRNSKNLRLVAITSGSKVEEELKEKYADEGLDEDIITDTIINTGLLLKVRNQYYPVRSCAMTMRTTSSPMRWHRNTCLRTASSGTSSWNWRRRLQWEGHYRMQDSGCSLPTGKGTWTRK